MSNRALSSPSQVGQFFKQLFADKSNEEIRQARKLVSDGGFADQIPDISTRCMVNASLNGLLAQRHVSLA